MERTLDNKVALVTGAQQGIGRSIAIAFGAAGARVIVNYLDDREAADAIVAEIRGADPADQHRALAIPGDVSRRADIETLLTASGKLGGIDILVNNAAVFPRVDFLAMSEAQWDAVLDVNLKGAFLCTQAVARQMVATGRGGCIINLVSVAAQRAILQGAHYVASKAGLIGFTRATALELAPHRIRVNAIAPGLTDTAQPRYGMTEAEICAAGEQVPLGGINTADDLAGPALFLASPAAARITGQTLHVNGGEYFY